MEEAFSSKTPFSWLESDTDSSGSFSSDTWGNSSCSGKKREPGIAFPTEPFQLDSRKKQSTSANNSLSKLNSSRPLDLKSVSNSNLNIVRPPSNQPSSKVQHEQPDVPSDQSNNNNFHVPEDQMKQIMSRLFSEQNARKRRDSLVATLSISVSSTIGRRDKMEDFYKTIPFESHAANGNNNNNPSNSNSNNNSNNNSLSTLAPPTDEQYSNQLPTCVSEQETYASDRPITQIEDKTNYAFFAVYDGHGGNQAADFVHKQLHSYIVEHPLFATDTEQAIREGFRRAETEFEEYSKRERIHGGVGTTACVGLIYNHTLYVANVGDSAAILCRRGEPVQLTSPHTARNPLERQRVEQVGGKIVREDRLGHPNWNPDMMNLGITRAIGDFYFKQDQYTHGLASGLIAEPEVVSIPLTTDDGFLLLASDGFWDVISTREAINYILQEYNQDPDSICNKLVELAERTTNDNTTVVLVKLKELEAVQASDANNLRRNSVQIRELPPTEDKPVNPNAAATNNDAASQQEIQSNGHN